MQITITGRGVQVQEAAREYAQEKATRLERYSEDLQKVEIIVSGDGDGKMVEMIAVPRRGAPIVGQEQHDDLYAAIDGVVDKMYAQLSKANKKRKDARKRSGRMPPPPAPSDLVEDEKLESYQDVVEDFSEKNLDR